ncbi:MAG: type II toxin-antitoxin system VapC family toxin [Actinomycetota bacterium]
MIVLDTTVLVYSKGEAHPLRESCRALIEAIADGTVEATTIPEVIQEFVHLRARRRSRRDAAELGRSFADLLSPLLTVGEDELAAGLGLFERHSALGAFDAILAATAMASGADALASADATFAHVHGLTHLVPGTPEFDQLRQR